MLLRKTARRSGSRRLTRERNSSTSDHSGRENRGGDRRCPSRRRPARALPRPSGSRSRRGNGGTPRARPAGSSSSGQHLVDERAVILVVRVAELALLRKLSERLLEKPVAREPDRDKHAEPANASPEEAERALTPESREGEGAVPSSARKRRTVATSTQRARVARAGRRGPPANRSGPAIRAATPRSPSVASGTGPSLAPPGCARARPGRHRRGKVRSPAIDVMPGAAVRSLPPLASPRAVLVRLLPLSHRRPPIAGRSRALRVRPVCGRLSSAGGKRSPNDRRSRVKLRRSNKQSARHGGRPHLAALATRIIRGSSEGQPIDRTAAAPPCSAGTLAYRRVRGRRRR